MKLVKASLLEVSKDWKDLFDNAISKVPFIDIPWLSNILIHPDVSIFYVYIIYDAGIPIIGIPILMPKYKGEYTDILYRKDVKIDGRLDKVIINILRTSLGTYYPTGANLKYNSYFVERNKDILNIDNRKQSWDIPLPSSFDEYLSRFKGKKRYNLKRTRKLLTKNHNVEIDIKCKMPQVGNFFKVHDMKWGRRLLDGKIGVFLIEVMNHLYLEGNLWLSQLKVDGEVVYMMFSIQCGSVLYYAISGYNGKYEKYSPGMILNLAVIEETINQGLKEYDMMKGNAWYKQHLGAVGRDRYFMEGKSG